MATTLLNIPLKSIRENPVALRSVNTQSDDFAGLVASIRARGVLNAISVRRISSPDGQELYGLVDGLHRYTASMDVGLDTIPASVLDMNDAETMEAQLIANAHKIETKPVEYSKHLQRILAGNPLMTMAELAGKLAKSSAWLTERLGMLKLAEAVAKLVDEGKINLTNGYALAKLPPEEQPDFVDRAITMTPTEFVPTVLARKKEIDTAKRQGREAKPAEFVPIAHLQKLAEIKTEYEQAPNAERIVRIAGAKTPADGFRAALAWVLHLDSESVEFAKQKYAAQKAAQEKKKEEAKAEREKKRAEAAANEAAKAATTV